MLQILYVCDKVLSPLDRIAVLGTNYSTVYSWGYVFPLERFIISMLKYNCIVDKRFICHPIRELHIRGPNNDDGS